MGRWLPRSLTTRLILTLILLVALVSVLVGSVTALALRHYLLARLDSTLVSAAARHEGFGPPGLHVEDPLLPCATEGSDGPGDSHAQSPHTILGRFDPTCRSAAVLNDNGGWQLLNAADTSVLAGLTPSDDPRTVSLSIGDYRVIADQDAPGMASRSVTGLPLHDVDDAVNSVVLQEGSFALAGVLLAALIGQALVRRQLSPLRRVAATATNVTRLPLESGEVGVIERVPGDLTDPTTEVGQVGAAFNAMLDHVERALDTRQESEQRVRRFVADASHELRTPLSTVMGYAELSRRTSADPAAMHHAMARIQSESGRMSALVDDLLLLARLDSGRPLANGDVDVALLLAEAVNDARVLSQDHRWQLTLPPEGLHVAGDRDRLHQVVSNLLSNAIRHTPAGTTVSVSAEGTVRVANQPHGVLLNVRDNGPGLSESLAGKEFERFSRGEASRTRDSGGTGLGLSIVQAIVTAHHGTVTLQSSSLGTSVTIWLPATSFAAS